MRSLLPVFILSLCLVVTGCAPTSQALRENPKNSYEFLAEENYQSVYRKILPVARKCYQGGLITAQMVVQDELYHDIKSGSVSVALHGAFGVETYLTIDVLGLNNSRTKISVFTSRNWKAVGDAVIEWVEDGSTKCSSQRNKVKKPDVVNEHQQ